VKKSTDQDSVNVRQRHWDAAYADRGEQVSWHQADPRLSVELVQAVAGDRARRDGPVIDVGGGTSRLASRLVSDGFTDVTVLDVAPAAIEAARRRPGGDQITWIQADLLTWRPSRRYQIWHDRAVFHFLTDPADRTAYLAILHAALAPGGVLVLATFAPGGPTHCSGLPVARYTADDLAKELNTGLAAHGETVIITGQRTEQHHTPAGAVQPFSWITARFG
jgi:trans-aconitate methyltransferase